MHTHVYMILMMVDVSNLFTLGSQRNTALEMESSKSPPSRILSCLSLWQ